MSRIRRSIGIFRMVCISVIGNHHNLVSVRFGSLNHIVYTCINSLHSLNDSILYSRMSNHVAIGKVQADKVELLLVQLSHQGILHLIGTHLRLQIIGCNLR